MTMQDRRPMAALADASDYLESLINREREPSFAYARLDLRPVQALLDRLGRPHESLSVIHVAGSKGKGSTCLFAEAILARLGERVGCFTSPHLESWVERFRICGAPVEEARLVSAVAQIRPIVDELRAGPRETLPSFFDATTAIAFLLFAEAGVDRALIEVGLGGRLDSTNVVDPVVTCITSIELEHTDKLGDTEAAIAAEKAGILKARRAAVIGSLRPDADRVIRARAKALGAPLIALGEDFTVEAPKDPASDESFVYRETSAPTKGFEIRATLSSPGDAAIRNAGLAIACVRTLAVYSDAEVAEASREALHRFVLPARIEVLAHDPEVIVDSAHTAESALALASALETLAPNGIELILSVSSDKNLDALLDALLPRTRRVWLTRAEPSRSMAVDVLEKSVRARAPAIQIESVEDAEEAARRARAELDPGARLCAAGSIYLAGIVRRILGSAGDLR
jgi:dihydrofolate synthase/folylpolyglutamate synthase